MRIGQAAKLIFVTLWSVLVVAGVAADAAADESLTKFFRELRARRFYKLGEKYCRNRLSSYDISPTRRLQLTLELSRTLAEHALFADQEYQTALWRQANAVIDEFLAVHPDHPRLLVLRLQSALIPATNGQSLRYQVELTPYDDTLRRRATAVLNDAISQLRGVETLIQQKLQQQLSPQTPPRGEDQLDSSELEGLSLRTRYQIAVVLLDEADVELTKSPKRSAQLLEAVRLLRSVPSDASIAGEAQLLLGRCLQLQGHRQMALRLLEKVARSGPAAGLADRITAQRIRVLLKLGRAGDAAELIDQYAIAGSRLPGEIAFLDVRVLATHWQAALRREANQEAQGLKRLLDQRVKQVEQEQGGYWGQRASIFLQLASESAELGEQLAMDIRRARSLYANAELSQAIEVYGLAAGNANLAGKSDLAFDLAYTRASLQLKLKQAEAAERSFEELYKRFPRNSRVDQAHLLRAYALGQIYSRRRTKSRRIAYTTALETHRERFVNHPSAADATWLLAQLQEQRLQTSKALKLYQEIPEDHSRSPAAHVGVARCYEKILRRLRSLKRPTDQWHRQAVEELHRLLPPDADHPTVLDPLQSEVAMRLARILLDQEQPDFEAADQLLAWIFTSDPPIQTMETRPGGNDSRDHFSRIRASATQLRILSLAGQNLLHRATELLDNLSETNPTEMLYTIDGLSQLVSSAGESVNHDLGRLQLQAAEKLDHIRDQLSPAQQINLDRCLAQAYHATGRTDQAVEVYETLVARHPNDKQLQGERAEMLVHCGTRSCLTQAQSLLRKLETGHKAGSGAWLNLRFRRARCALELKEYQQCRKLLGVTALLYPELGGAELKGKFVELQAKCEGRIKTANERQ